MASGPAAPAGGSVAKGWRLNVLGPVELSYGGEPVRVAGTTRALLGLLARTPGEEVSTAAIVAAVWGSAPPEDAEKEVASHVSRLRRALTAVAPSTDPTRVVVTLPAGYILDLPASDVDICVFERLAADGRRAISVGQPALALQRLDVALALWRGAAYEDFGEYAFARDEAARLAELRLSVVELRIEARLALAAPQAPPELEADLNELLAEHWHRERLWALLATALFRQGRRGDALAACRTAHERLAEGFGATAGPYLRAVEQAVVAGDPALHGTPLIATTIPADLDLAAPECLGREEELAWLMAALDLAATRRAQVRLIVGGPGIGKSRLVAEVARRAAQRGVATRYWQGGVAGLSELVAAADRVNLVILDDLDRAAHEDVVALTDLVRAARDGAVAVLVTCREPVRLGDLQGAPRLVLSVLDDKAIAEIVRGYAPGTATVAALAAVRAASGVPARVHRLASEWAFHRAGRRIDRAVADSTQPLRWLATVDNEVAGGVLDLGFVRERARVLRGPERSTVDRPYPGLARFEPGDAQIFFGRERLVAQLVARLVRAPLLAVVGAGGTGKSSAVRAGLLPALAAGVLPSSSQWHRILLTPTTLGGSLAALLDSVSSNAGAGNESAEVTPEVTDQSDQASNPQLVVVDQFDEVFTELSPADRDVLVSTLVAAAGRGRVVLTMRPETLAHCANHPDLARVVSANTALVTAMTADELRRAVQRPAHLAGLELEDGLVDLIVADAGQAPGDTASLQAALYATWQRRSGTNLTREGYAAAGGILDAVQTLAEAAYTRLGPAERELARRVLLRLASPRHGQAPEPGVAGHVDLAELTILAGPGGSAALERLVELGLARFTETVAAPADVPAPAGHDRVELASSALLRQWPRLRSWLGEVGAELELRRHVAEAATTWVGQGRPTTGLYRGARLVAALDWAASHSGELTAGEREFIGAGERAALLAENRRQRRIVRLWKWLAASIAVAIVGAAVGTVAVVQEVRAHAAAQRADAAALAARAGAEPDPRRALLLAAAAAQLDPARADAIVAVLDRAPELVAAGGPGVTALAIGPDGGSLAAGTRDGAVLLLDRDTLRTEARLDQPAAPGPIHGLTFTRDGGRLVSWGGPAASAVGPDQGSGASIAVWDLASRQLVGTTFGDAWSGPGGGLAADGVTLILAQLGEQREIVPVAWSLPARTPSTAYPLPAGAVTSVGVSADGRVLVLGEASGSTVVELATGEQRWLDGARGPLGLSPDGTTLLSSAGDSEGASQRSEERTERAAGQQNSAGDSEGASQLVGAAQLLVWDVVTGTRRALIIGGGEITATAWSPDGRTFATATTDGSMTTWDARSLRRVRTLTGSGIAASVLAFGADGGTLYSATPDAPMLAWDLTATRGAGAALPADASAAALIRTACAVAARDMSREEWNTILPGRSPRQICPS